MADYPTENALVRLNSRMAPIQLAYVRGDWSAATAGWQAVRRDFPAMTAPYFGYLGAGGTLEELSTYRDEWQAVQSWVPAWTRPSNTGVLAEALRRLSDGPGSAAVADEFAHLSGTFITNGFGWFYGPFDTALGVLRATAGDLDSAVTHLGRAVEQCDEIESPVFGAIARLELATAARRRGGPGDAELVGTASDAARQLAEQVSMPGWLERLDRFDAGDPEPWRLASER